jgi:hypothetical protein
MARKDPLAHLGRHADLPDTLAREVRALGAAAVPRLAEMVHVEDAASDTPEGRAAWNAATLLARWSGTEAREALRAAFLRARPGTPWHDHVEWAVGKRLDAGEWLFAYRGTLKSAAALRTLVYRWGEADPRVSDWIREVLRDDPEEGAHLARWWDDPSLLTDLEATFDRLEARPVVAEVANTLIALLEAADARGATDNTRATRLRAKLELEVREAEAEAAVWKRREEVLRRFGRG